MRNLLSRPYRLPNIGTASWRNALVFALFIFLFLQAFQPFGMSAYPGSLWKAALGYGLTCAAVMLLLNGFVASLLPRLFAEPNWTVGREIAWTLVNVALIGLANLLYSVAIGFASFSARTLLGFEAYTVMIGLFPIAAGILWKEARLSKRYEQGSERMNTVIPQVEAVIEEQIEAEPAPLPPISSITIPSENGREDLILPLSELLFISSAGNYLEVHQVTGSDVKRHLLRGSLKSAEEALVAHPRLLRCHKSHLVNLDRVTKVSGNAQGYHLHLEQGEITVPVSRKLNESLPGLFAGRP